MAQHRAHAQFERAKWRKSLLFAAWAAQLGVMAVLLGLFGWRLSSTLKTSPSDATVSIVWESTNIGLPVLALALTSYEFFRYSHATLTPWTMLFTNTVKMTCSVGVLVLDIYVYVVQKPGYYYAVAGLILDSLFFTCTLVPAAYSIHTYNRTAVFNEYITANAKPYGSNCSITDLERQEKAYAQRLYASGLEEPDKTATPVTIPKPAASIPAPVPATIVTAPTYVEPVISPPSTPPRKSISSFVNAVSTSTSAPRRSSIASSTRSDISTSTESVYDTPVSPTTSIGSPVPLKSPVTALPMMSPSTPYSHERDTQFEAYMAERSQRQQQFTLPPRSPRRNSSGSIAGSIAVSASSHSRSLSAESNSFPASPSSRSVVAAGPKFLISPPEISMRRSSAGPTMVLGVVPEEVEAEAESVDTHGSCDSNNDDEQTVGLLGGGKQGGGEIHSKKARRPLVEQSQELLSEVDLDADEDDRAASSRKRRWNGAVKG